MNHIIPGIVISFREALEGCLVLVLLLNFLDKVASPHLKINALYGLCASLFVSLLLGLGFHFLGVELETMENFEQLWTSIASLVAVGLVTSFIVLMIKHGHAIKQYVEKETAVNLTAIGVFFVSFILLAREGVEIAIFTFAGQYNAFSIVIGIVLAIIVSFIIYFSLFKVSISKIFKITMIYLIIQAGYLIWYSIHDGLGALNGLGIVENGSVRLTKLFDLSGTMLNHENGTIGLVLNVVFGWHSDPEWLQFLVQYIFTFGIFAYWIKKTKRQKIH